MSRGASMPILTFSPETASTVISISSPIMMLWLIFRVNTSMDARTSGRGLERLGGTVPVRLRDSSLAKGE